ncbi:MAG: sialidase family protein, partial [Candidatus Aminicenantes bacterium]|nr:sialidase family protein [Candidatus Aminicenantes bacterium]
MTKRTILLLIIWGVIFGGLTYASVENISNSAAGSEDAHVAINSSGEIGAIWLEKFSNGGQHVYFSIYRNGQWSTPAGIPGQSGSNADPCIAKGVNGGFVAAWYDLAFYCVRFSEYTGSWSTPITVSQVGGYDMGSPSITTTTNGRIAVGWQRGNSTFPDAYVAIGRGGSWSGPVNISNTAFGSKYIDLAPGPNGEIYAVWQDNLYLASANVDYFYTMMSSDHGNGSWTTPQIIDNLNGWTFRPVVAVNSSNDILSCFYYMQGSSYWAANYLNGSWQSPQLLSDTGDHYDHNLYFSEACPYGNDGFLYIYRNCNRNIVYLIIRNGSVGNRVVLTSSNQTYHPSIDYSSSIGAVAAWTDFSVSSDVFVAIFDP